MIRGKEEPGHPQMDRPVEVDGSASILQSFIEHARQQTEQTRAVLEQTISLPQSDFIPGYTVLREIHRGGQGIVYEATQHRGRRRVALKVLRDGALAGPVEQLRFKREVQILAQFQHPNIVRLYEGGAVDGKLFYAMDFVDGLPFDTYLRQTRCTIKDTLRLVEKIAEAVHAAHLKGFVHRDLKPANIRVGTSGDPHLLDFGLAKLVQGSLDSLSGASITVTGQFMGSLPWAAPEQVDGTPEGVDIRTDVYALGVILYHGLTGQYPYEVIGSMRGIVDHIVNSEPPRPSTVQEGIDDDVDTIVLKCLNKERERRYQSAGELAEDIRHYLSGEPIAAKRESTWYLLRKAAERHRSFAVASSVFAMATVMYAATMTQMYRRARHSELESKLAATKADLESQELQTVLESFVDSASRKLGRIPGAREVRQELNEIAYEQLHRLIHQHESSPGLSATLARSTALLADIAQAIGDQQAARQHTLKSRELYQEAASQDPANLDLQADYSIALVRQGDIAALLGLNEEKSECYHQAMAMDRKLVALAPENQRFLDNLAWSCDRVAMLYRLSGRTEEASRLHEEMLDLGSRLVDRHPDSAAAHWTKFSAYWQQVNAAQSMSDWQAFVAKAEDALASGRKVLELEPLNPNYLERVSRSLAHLCWLYSCNGDPQQALALAGEAQRGIDRLVALNAIDPAEVPDLSTVYACHAQASAKMGDNEAERQTVQQAIDVLEEANRRRPGDSHILAKLSQFTAHKARLALATTDDATARVQSEKALRLASEALQDPIAGEEALEAVAAVMAGNAMPEFRDTAGAVIAYERIRNLPGFHRDVSYLEAYARMLAADGQLERAHAIADEGLAQLPKGESFLRARLENLKQAGSASATSP